MKHTLLAFLTLVASCSFYFDDPVLTDGPDAGTDAEPGIDARVEDGVFLACGVPTPCPAPSVSSVTVCGYLFDVETGSTIAAAGATGALCDPLAPTDDGPCALQVQFYDPLAFAANPAGTSTLNVDAIEVFDCGAFRGIDVTRPFNGFLAVVTDDAGAADRVAPTAISRPFNPREVATDFRAWSTRAATDQAWRASAGSPFGGESFAEHGVHASIFLRNGTPAAGVTLTRGGNVAPADDYYFSDTTPIRSTVDPAAMSTGPNGAGLLVNTALGNVSGEGGLPLACEWSSQLGTSVPGVVWLAEQYAHLAGDSGTACPD